MSAKKIKANEIGDIGNGKYVLVMGVAHCMNKTRPEQLVYLMVIHVKNLFKENSAKGKITHP